MNKILRVLPAVLLIGSVNLHAMKGTFKKPAAPQPVPPSTVGQQVPVKALPVPGVPSKPLPQVPEEELIVVEEVTKKPEVKLSAPTTGYEPYSERALLAEIIITAKSKEYQEDAIAFLTQLAQELEKLKKTDVITSLKRRGGKPLPPKPQKLQTVQSLTGEQKDTIVALAKDWVKNKPQEFSLRYEKYLKDHNLSDPDDAFYDLLMQRIKE